MPVHLPPIPRRSFLRRLGLAGAGLALASRGFAAPRRVDRHTFAFFSDTHISGDLKKVVRDINMAEHLRIVTRDVLRRPEQPAALFLTGDCAYNSGEVDDYFQLTALLDPLRAAGIPLHLALGNHDHRENFGAALPEAVQRQPSVVDRQAALIESPRVNWFLLDSLELTLQTPGLIGERQLAWLAETLDANPRKPAIVLVHHQPNAGGAAAGALKDTDGLLAVLRPRRQVKAWVFGHTHTWRTTTDDSGLHLINLPPVAYTFRPEEPAGWVHATVRREGMRLELSCVNAARQNHGQIVELTWRKA